MIDKAALDPANAAFIEQLFESFQADPQSVAPEWRRYFENLQEVSPSQPAATAEPAPTAAPEAVGTPFDADAAGKQVCVLQLINSYRFLGHRQANLDPLNLYERPAVPDLEPEYHGLAESDMDQTFNTGSLMGPPQASLREIVDIVHGTYCGSIGAEYMHITATEQKRWLQERLEPVRGRGEFSNDQKREILRSLTAARKLEEYLHKKYVGQKRFSLEGGDTLIPLLDQLVRRAGAQDVKEIVIGMAHRGRLNVLVNILGKHPEVLFSEFEGKHATTSGSGDVKYHLGFSSDVETPGGPVHLVLAFNPSHLEIINPVVEGSVRARQVRRNDHARRIVLPILIHGDAAFAGQGVVMETLNLSETRGYGTGGTVHVVVNNQIGFTTSDPLDSRSSLYCTDVAKLVQAPIFHVNGNDPEAVLFVTQLALDFRMRFAKDVVIDMVCYRRFGHNEADEPLATQPMMYKKIREQSGVRQEYADALVAEGVLKEGEPDQMSEDYVTSLESGNLVSSLTMAEAHSTDHLVDWTPYLGTHWRDEATTGVPVETVERLGHKMCEHPDGFTLHRSVSRIVHARREMADGKRPVDWGFAETLAYACLLEDGFAVRVSGQDSERGTFFHRHAVMHNQDEKGYHIPLQNLYEGQPRFRVINSLLSEEAVLGFEFGYSTAEPETLVIWEAQFGDFVNGAQVVIDQFISSSEAKWGRFCGLTMLLPHGYDGQGPEHSSARLERFLQLCAEENIQVCMPSSPAQIFHLLRRQMCRPFRKPLVIMSPKSLLRSRSAVSTREEIAGGHFQMVIDDVDNIDPVGVSRLVLCSGKVYYDIIERRREDKLNHVAIARVEQLYPYPKEEIEALLNRYPNANDVIWAQEEPRNQGSWFHMLSRRHLAGSMKPRHRLGYAGRDYSASPAVGYLSVHMEQQKALVATALGLDAVTDHGKKT